MRELFLSFLFLNGLLAFSQNIVGTVRDNDEGLIGATAMLLGASDSVIHSFAISDATGKFVINKAFNGDYILQVNFVGFKTFSKKVTVKGNDVVIGEVQMETDLLDDLIVEGERIPIEMKKDTIEYNASTFKTKPNAVVEDLLKKLPGVEVDRNGGIKAQGEEVNKVLVDGKEFFGDDPLMATKNLEADAIDKVQVFDKKSEFAEFSGIDDGNEQKTINLALKDDRKQGTFGRVGAGGGTDETFRLDANINQFRKDNQFSLITKHNNINEQGFSIGDYITFMGGMSNLSGGGGGFSINSSVPIGDDISNGFVTTSVAGVNLNRDFSEKNELQSNYLFSRINNIQKITTTTSYLDGFQNIDQSSESESLANMHQLNLNFKTKLSDASDIQIKNSISFDSGGSDGESYTETTTTVIEKTKSVSSSTRDALNLNSRLIFRQRFSKSGRTFMAEGRVNRNEKDAEGTLSRNSDNDALDLEQETNSTSFTTILGTEISFTEPIGKSKYLELRLEHENTINEDDQLIYDVSGGGRVIDPLQTQLFTRDYISNTGGLSFNYVKDKVKFTFGSNYEFGDLTGTVARNNSLKRDFDAGLPYVRTSYDFSNSMNLIFNYSTSQLVPTIRQLQPVLDLSSPTYQYKGNPDLNASYVHTAQINFHLFDQFTSKNFFVMMTTTIIERNIVNARERVVGSNLQLSQPINSGKAVNLTNYASFSGRIRFAKLQYRVSNQLSKNTGNTISENSVFETRTIINTMDVSIENAKKEKIDWVIGVRIIGNDTKSEDTETANQSLSNTAYYNDVTWYFAKKWSFTSNFDLTLYSDEGIGGGSEVYLWKTSLQRNFLKNDRGQFKFSVFDMLNQNLGINQTANTLLIQEQRIESLGRYFMIGLTYKLSNYESGGIMFRGR